MRALAIIFFLVFSVSLSHAAKGAGDVGQGNALYRKGKYQDAIGHYEKAAQKNPSEAKIEYDLGTASYKAGDFDAAVDHFQKGLLTDDEKLKRNVHYDLGDAFYRSGIMREEKDAGEAIKRLQSSLESFDKVLALDAKDKEAAENCEFVKKEIERLKKKRQEQQQKKQQQQQQQQQSKDDQQKNGQQKESQPQQEGQNEKQKAQDQKEEQKPEPQQESQKKNPASGQNKEAQISSQKDADAKLDDFERNELPKGFLKLMRQSQAARPVEKDW